MINKSNLLEYKRVAQDEVDVEQGRWGGVSRSRPKRWGLCRLTLTLLFILMILGFCILTVVPLRQSTGNFLNVNPNQSTTSTINHKANDAHFLLRNEDISAKIKQMKRLRTTTRPLVKGNKKKSIIPSPKKISSTKKTPKLHLTSSTNSHRKTKNIPKLHHPSRITPHISGKLKKKKPTTKKRPSVVTKPKKKLPRISPHKLVTKTRKKAIVTSTPHHTSIVTKSITKPTTSTTHHGSVAAKSTTKPTTSTTHHGSIAAKSTTKPTTSTTHHGSIAVKTTRKPTTSATHPKTTPKPHTNHINFFNPFISTHAPKMKVPNPTTSTVRPKTTPKSHTRHLHLMSPVSATHAPKPHLPKQTGKDKISTTTEGNIDVEGLFRFNHPNKSDYKSHLNSHTQSKKINDDIDEIVTRNVILIILVIALSIASVFACLLLCFVGRRRSSYYGLKNWRGGMSHWQDADKVELLKSQAID